MKLDFLTIEPRKEFNNFYKEDIYIIPCRLLEIGEEASHNSLRIKIEHLDFLTGEVVQRDALCYKASLKYFVDQEFPIKTECSLIKQKTSIKFLVYGNFYPDDLYHGLLGTYDGKTREELLEVFKKNYKELNEWTKIPSQFQ